MKKRVEKKKTKKDFFWYALRAGLYIMIASELLYFLTRPRTVWARMDYGLSAFVLFNYLFMASTLFTFIMSIIHLKKYKEKTFAIVSLILSGIVVLLNLLGIIFGPINIS